MRRYRERRAAVFTALRAVEIVPAWDTPMKELQRLFDVHCNAPETPAPQPTETRDPAPTTEPETHLQREQAVSGDEPATAISTNTNTNTNKEEGRAPRKRSAPPATVPKPEDVDQQTWGDWIALRTKKRATVSLTVVEEARRECAKAGLTLERFLQVWCMRGSQGLEAAWLKPDERGHATGETAYQRSMRERIEEAAPSIARRAPAQQQDATDYFRTVDVPARDVTRHAIEVQP
jgi:hypothetical protein